MNLIFKLVMFAFLANIAVGIMSNLIPYTVTCSFSNEAFSKFNSTQGYVNPNNNIQDQTSAFIRLIDSLNIGVIGKFLSSINYYLYGIIDYTRCFIGMTDWLEYLMKGFLTMAYILGSVYLWTGRKLN